MVASIVLTGLAIGCIYALIAITYNVMFSASRVFSFTAGTLGMLGGVLGSLFILRMGMPVAVGFLLALAGGAIIGQTTLGSGQTQALLEKPEYWAKVYPNNFRPVCYAAGGKLSDRTSTFLDRLRSARIEMGDTLLWWIALGYDSPRMIAEAMKNVGTEPEQIVGYLNKLKEFPGVYGDIAFTADKHDGYPDNEVVMVEANSLKDGAFNLAPGYSA